MSIDSQNVVRPKAIIFDWDNTLITSHMLFTQCFLYALNKLKIDHSVLESDVFRQNIHYSMRDGFPKIFGENWEKVNKAYNDYFSAVHLDHLQLMTGAEELLKCLHDAGVVLSIVSNKDGIFVRREVENLGLHGYFHKIIGANDTANDKPSPIPAFHALDGKLHKNEFGKNIWFIGDSIADLECGVNSGCHPILFKDHVDAVAHVKRKKIKCSQVFSHKELIDMFDKSKKQSS
jgi:phosphoglycolate phosphatase